MLSQECHVYPCTWIQHGDRFENEIYLWYRQNSSMHNHQEIPNYDIKKLFLQEIIFHEVSF